MKIQHPMAHLWANIAALMSCPPDQPGLLDRVQKKTKLGRGIIQRVKKGPEDLERMRSEGAKEPSIELRSLVAIADSFSVEVWELLRPPQGVDSKSREFIVSSLLESVHRLSDDELASLAESVKLAIAQKRNGETPGVTHEPAGVYFGPERRLRAVDVPADRREGPTWTVDSTKPKKPRSRPQEGTEGDQT